MPGILEKLNKYLLLSLYELGIEVDRMTRKLNQVLHLLEGTHRMILTTKVNNIIATKVVIHQAIFMGLSLY